MGISAVAYFLAAVSACGALLTQVFVVDPASLTEVETLPLSSPLPLKPNASSPFHAEQFNHQNQSALPFDSIESTGDEKHKRRSEFAVRSWDLEHSIGGGSSRASHMSTAHSKSTLRRKSNDQIEMQFEQSHDVSNDKHVAKRFGYKVAPRKYSQLRVESSAEEDSDPAQGSFIPAQRMPFLAFQTPKIDAVPHRAPASTRTTSSTSSRNTAMFGPSPSGSSGVVFGELQNDPNFSDTTMCLQAPVWQTDTKTKHDKHHHKHHKHHKLHSHDAAKASKSVSQFQQQLQQHQYRHHGPDRMHQHTHHRSDDEHQQHFGGGGEGARGYLSDTSTVQPAVQTKHKHRHSRTSAALETAVLKHEKHKSSKQHRHSSSGGTNEQRMFVRAGSHKSEHSWEQRRALLESTTPQQRQHQVARHTSKLFQHTLTTLPTASHRDHYYDSD